MQHAVEIADHRVIALHRRRGDIAVAQPRLLPEAAAAVLVQPDHHATIVGHHHRRVADRHAAGAAVIAGPHHLAAGTVDGDGAALVAAGEQAGAFQHRRGIDVGHALEFGTPVGLGDRGRPQHVAVVHVQGREGPVVPPHEQDARAEGDAGGATHGQRRRLDAVEPAAGAGAGIERGDPAIVGVHEHHAAADRRRGQDFVADLAGPLLLPGGRVQRHHLTLQAADHHQAVPSAGAAAQTRLLGFVTPELGAGGERIGAHPAVDRGRVDVAIHDRRLLADAKEVLALADRRRPQLVDARGRGEVDQLGGLAGLVLVAAAEQVLDRAAARKHRHRHRGDSQSAQETSLVHQPLLPACGGVPPASISFIAISRCCGSATSTSASALR